LIGYRCLNRLGGLIKRHKDKNPMNLNNNVIYRIFCKNGVASYVD